MTKNKGISSALVLGLMQFLIAGFQFVVVLTTTNDKILVITLATAFLIAAIWLGANLKKI